ncbi:hypothetical protein ACLOJK_029176, partial [Asimina triloba]
GSQRSPESEFSRKREGKRERENIMEVASAAAAPPVPSGNNTNGGTPQRRAKQTLRGLNKPKCIQCGNVARSRSMTKPPSSFASSSSASSFSFLETKIALLLLFGCLWVGRGAFGWWLPFVGPAPGICPFTHISLLVSVAQSLGNADIVEDMMCPFQSCKNCCAKAENLCHIHVLKSNSTLLDKPPPSSSSIDQSSSDTPTGASLRVSSLRQLFNSFAQFNRAQLPLRARKPLSRKDAAAINAWRFSKLKEYNERNIEIENEAFDRYMQNVNKASTSGEDETSKMVAAMKGRLKSNVERAGGFRKRVRDLVEQGLRKLQKREFDDEGKSGNADDNERKPRKPKKIEKWGTEMPAAVNDLLEKLRKKLNYPCSIIITGQADGHEDKDAKTADGQSGGNMSIGNPPQSGPLSSSYAVPKPYTSVEISQEDAGPEVDNPAINLFQNLEQQQQQSWNSHGRADKEEDGEDDAVGYLAIADLRLIWGFQKRRRKVQVRRLLGFGWETRTN